MEDLAHEIANLNINLHQGCEEIVAETLSAVCKHLNTEGTDKKAYVEFLLKKGIVETLAYYLQNIELLSASCLSSTVQIIADISKIDDAARKQCSEVSILKGILELLLSKDYNLVFLACRALTNTCYDNDAARRILREMNGIDKFMQLLKDLLKEDTFPDNLRTVTCGCLLNLLDTDGENQEQAIKAGIFDILLQYITKFQSDSEVVTLCLLVFTCLADCENGRVKLMDSIVLNQILTIFERPLIDEEIEVLLELFGSLCVNDAAKLQFAQIGLCEKWVQLIHERLENASVSSNDGFNAYKTISDFITLILTGDESMDELYGNGKGVVYQECIFWLKCADENLQVAGSLAVGNFARSDEHCIQMVEDGVSKPLLSLLQKHSSKDGDIRMQHAVLCAFRNLSIPVQNKSYFVKIGVVNTLVSMINVETYPVVFKLLGTLRMIVGNQEKVACDIGETKTFIERLVQWSGTDDHPGVKGEAMRLLAWVVKYSESSKVALNILDCDALPPIVSMLQSEHSVMQNEAINAIQVIAKNCFVELERIMDLSSLASGILFSLKNTPDVSRNMLDLLSLLLNSENIRTTLKSKGLLEELRVIKDQSGKDNETKICELLLILER